MRTSVLRRGQGREGVRAGGRAGGREGEERKIWGGGDERGHRQTDRQTDRESKRLRQTCIHIVETPEIRPMTSTGFVVRRGVRLGTIRIHAGWSTCPPIPSERLGLLSRSTLLYLLLSSPPVSLYSFERPTDVCIFVFVCVYVVSRICPSHTYLDVLSTSVCVYVCVFERERARSRMDR
jgi:hypothetical protein